MRIQQAYIGNRFFRMEFLRKYGLKRYFNKKYPMFLSGCYKTDMRVLLHHQGIIVIRWAGNDITNLESNKRAFTYINHNRSRIFHIAVSNYIEEDMKRFGWRYKKFLMASMRMDSIQPQPLGDSIYVYLPEGNEIYGYSTVKELQKRITDIPWIIHNKRTMQRNEVIQKIYPKCFIGLRLTKHDGESNTSLELLSMGRPVVSNSGMPWNLPYNSIDDIENLIRELHKNRENFDYHRVSQDITKAMLLPVGWNSTEFYLKP